MQHQPLVYSAVNRKTTQWQGVKAVCTPPIINSTSPQGYKWCQTVQIARILPRPPYKTNKNLKTQSWVEIRLLRIRRLRQTRWSLKLDKSLTHQSTSQKTSYKFWMSTVRVVSVKENLSKLHWPGSAWRSCAYLKSRNGKKRLSIDM